MTEWEPIESAPRDGTKVLVSYLGGRVIVNHWEVEEISINGVKRRFDGFQGDYLRGVERRATHWMPLPLPPPLSDMTQPMGE